jgi:hypothetical protein
LALIIPSFTLDKLSDEQALKIVLLFVFELTSTLISTLMLIMSLSIGINLNLNSAKAKKLIIDYSTCTDGEKLSIEYKSDCSYFYVKELTKPSRVTIFFS